MVSQINNIPTFRREGSAVYLENKTWAQHIEISRELLLRHDDTSMHVYTNHVVFTVSNACARYRLDPDDGLGPNRIATLEIGRVSV